MIIENIVIWIYVGWDIKIDKSTFNKYKNSTRNKIISPG